MDDQEIAYHNHASEERRPFNCIIPNVYEANIKNTGYEIEGNHNNSFTRDSQDVEKVIPIEPFNPQKYH